MKRIIIVIVLFPLLLQAQSTEEYRYNERNFLEWVITDCYTLHYIYDASDNLAEITQTTTSLDAPTTQGATRCGFGRVTLTASGSPTGQYQWFNSAGASVSGATGASYQTPFLAQSATYSVSYTTTGGCESARVAVTATILSEIDKPTITVLGDLIICTGSSVQLQSSPVPDGLQYLWTTGESTRTITVSSAGDYSVFHRLGTTCATQSDSVQIQVLNAPDDLQITVNYLEDDPDYIAYLYAPDRFSNGVQWYKNGIKLMGEIFRRLKVAEEGSYYFEVKENCLAQSPSFDVKIPELPTANDDEKLKNALKVFPNPNTSRLLFVSLKNSYEGGLKLSVLPISGQIALFTTTKTKLAEEFQQSLDLSNYASGSYLLKVELEDGRVAHKRFVIQ
jgi:hypothetical protein